MSRKTREEVERILLEGTLMDEAIAQATREAIRQHVRAGNPIAAEVDGKVRWLAPSEVQLDGDDGKRS